LWLYPPDWVNAHDGEIEADQKRALAGAPPVEISVGRIEALLAFDRRADLGQIRTPTLILSADNDGIIPTYYAEALARAIPGARLQVLHGGGHAFNKTRPDQFNRLVLEFLQEQL
jgi:aminoacrylate hydrolase